MTTARHLPPPTNRTAMTTARHPADKARTRVAAAELLVDLYAAAAGHGIASPG